MTTVLAVLFCLVAYITLDLMEHLGDGKPMERCQSRIFRYTP